MDPRPRLSRVGLVAGALALSACAGAASTGPRLPAGATVLARGSLAYAVGFTEDDRVVSIELEERFALVVRSRTGRELGRHDLGPAERDLVALAIVGDTAWVGGDDQRVRAIALADGRLLATWPIGADVTALAANAEHVLVGEATGALCLRRPDGGLLHCVQLGDRPITEIALAPGHELLVVGGDRRHGLRLPGLTIVPPPPLARFILRGRQVWRDGAVLVELAGPIRAVAVDDRGVLAIAGWIRALGDPSVILLPAAP